MNSLKQLIVEEIKILFLLKKTERLWHIALLASLCTGTPLLIGYFLNDLSAGVLACIAGLVILYLPSNSSIADRMLTLFICALGFIVSFTIGAVGGWFIYHEKIRFHTIRRIQKVSTSIKRRK
jgi:hypothetical protein